MNEEPQNNSNKQGTAREALTNTMQGLAQPKPGLVFLFTLFLLNYKFWLVVFGEGEIAYKILTIGNLYPIRLDFWYFYNNWDIWSKNFNAVGILLLKVVIAFVVSIIYPAIINFTKLFYTKKTSKIPTDVNEEYIREKSELKKKIKALEEVEENRNYRISQLKNNIKQLSNGMDDDKLLEISRKIEIYGENIYGPDKYLYYSNMLSIVLFIKLNSNKDRISMLNLCGDTTDAFIDITLKTITETEDIKTKFKTEIDKISDEIDLKKGKFDKFNKKLRNYEGLGLFSSNIVSHLTKHLGREFYILGYFIEIDESYQRKLNIQGQLVLAKALYRILKEVRKKTEEEKQIILSLLPDLKEDGKTLEEILQNLFKEET